MKHVKVYQVGARWHFLVLETPTGRQAAFGAVYDSQSDDRIGFPSEEEALAAGYDYIHCLYDDS